MENSDLMDPNSVELTIPEAGLPTDPKTLGLLYFRATLAQQLVDRIKAHTREILQDGGEVEGLFLRRGNRRTQITDARQAFELLREEVPELTADQFLKCCKVSLPNLEQIFHLHSKTGTIQSNKTACRELLKEVCATTEGAPVVAFSKPENAR